MPTATQTVSAGTPVLQAQATPPAADADAAPPIEAEATPVAIEGVPREWRAVGVAVVEDGLLHELGTHDELLERDGAYAALWDSWQS